LLSLGLWPGKKYIIPLKTFPSRSKMLDYLEEAYWGEELRKRKQPTGQLVPSFKVLLSLFLYFSSNLKFVQVIKTGGTPIFIIPTFPRIRKSIENSPSLNLHITEHFLIRKNDSSCIFSN
jgi:hypothetical protein